MKSNSSFAMLTAFALSAAAGLPFAATAAPAGIGPSFKGPLGLQLYSLRDQFKKDMPGTLDKVRAFGFQYVELAGTYGLKNEEFKAMLAVRSLKPIASHYPFEQLRDDIEAVVRDARAFGLKYAGCAWIPHNDPFDEQTCREAIAVFNKAGEALAKHGIKFFYHCHGYEFQTHGGTTLMDLMMKETKPKFVTYEMDVFWAAHAGQDPVKLLKQYPKRWQLTHVKGMKDSTPTGLFTGHSDVSNDVPLGEGKIDYQAFLSAAKKAGVKWYFIEDESPLVLEQIPKSLRYLETVKW